MIRAAGILFLTPDGRSLFCKRGDGASNPGEWACPGGKIEDGETTIQAAIRETMEEAGIAVAEKDLTLLCRAVANAEVAASAGLPPTDAVVVPGEAVDFTTFLCRVPESFLPTLDYEHTGFAWADLDAPPEPLHPGMRLAIERMTMDELGVARAMADGRLPSPQQYRNVHLWSVRITGTGYAYRPSIDEFCYRPPEKYLNDDFLAKCNGLAVIIEHPERAVMNSEEFADRNVGAVMLPFIKGDEVWGIVRIYDDWTNEALKKEEASTSPTVLLKPGTSRKMFLEDGKPLLIEGEIDLLDHIAVLPEGGRGVWDKCGPPVGVDRSGVEEFADSVPGGLNANDKRLQAAYEKAVILSARMGNHLSSLAR